MKFRLGQIITFNKDKKISVEGGGTLIVKSGDKAQILRKVDDETGEILYITGDAKGKSQIVSIAINDKIDSDVIADKIMSLMKWDLVIKSTINPKVITYVKRYIIMTI